MKLDISCVRDVLLTVEKYEGFDCPVTFSTYAHEHYAYFMDFLSEYDRNIVFYHVRYCIEANLLKDWNSDQKRFVCSLTPTGHDFLANTRTPEQWSWLQKIVSGLGDASLKIVSSVAEGITTALLNQKMQEVLPMLFS